MRTHTHKYTHTHTHMHERASMLTHRRTHTHRIRTHTRTHTHKHTLRPYSLSPLGDAILQFTALYLTSLTAKPSDTHSFPHTHSQYLPFSLSLSLSNTHTPTRTPQPHTLLMGTVHNDWKVVVVERGKMRGEMTQRRNCRLLIY